MKVDISEYLASVIEVLKAFCEEAKDLRARVSTILTFLVYKHGISQETLLEGFALGDWTALDDLLEKFQIRRQLFLPRSPRLLS